MKFKEVLFSTNEKGTGNRISVKGFLDVSKICFAIPDTVFGEPGRKAIFVGLAGCSDMVSLDMTMDEFSALLKEAITDVS